MRKKYTKVIFAVFSCVLLISCLFISCFAVVDDPALLDPSDRQSYVVYNDWLNSSFDISTYRYGFVDCHDYNDENSDLCSLVLDSYVNTFSPVFDHNGFSFSFYTNDIGFRPCYIGDSSSALTYYTLFGNCDSCYMTIRVQTAYMSTVPSSLSDITPSSIYWIRLSSNFNYSQLSYYGAIPVSSSNLPSGSCVIQTGMNLYFRSGVGETNEGGYIQIYDSTSHSILPLGTLKALTFEYNYSFVPLYTFCNCYSSSGSEISIIISSVVPPSGSEEESSSIIGVLTSFVFSLFQAPAVVLSSMLDFTIFGINFYGVFKVLLTLSLAGLLIAFIVKIILHFKS